MHRKDVERYDELNSKLISLKGDIALLSAKKPNETVNEFKLNLINKMLAQINDLIKEFKPENDFEAFDLDVLHILETSPSILKEETRINSSLNLNFGRSV